MRNVVMTIVVACAASGCATMFSGDTQTTISLYPAHPGVTVLDNGVPLKLERQQLRELSGPVRARVEQMAGVRIDRGDWVYRARVDRTKDHDLQITGPAGTQRVRAHTGMRGMWFWLNLFTSGPVGIIVDLATGKWRTLEGGRVVWIDLDRVDRSRVTTR